MKLKVLTGHLTSSEIKNIKVLLSAGAVLGRTKRKTFKLDRLGDSETYVVLISVRDRGLIPVSGSKLRLSTYSATFCVI